MNSTIVKVEVGRFDYDFAGEFKFFKPDADGVTRRPSVLVRLTTDNGVQGWGQSVPVPSWTYETVESVESTLTNYIAESLLGADPTDMEDIHARMTYVIRPGLTTGMPLSKAAIDFACYDIAGKQAGKSVSELLGGARRDSLELNWTIASPNMATIEQQLAEGRERGYAHYTVKIGPPQTLEYDVQLIHTVRDFAPDSFLWTDANTNYTLEEALEIAPKLADAGFQAFESPLPPTHFRGYQALKKQGAVPIYMDEGIISPNEVGEFIALNMFDGITLKPARCAGLWASQQIVNCVKENGMNILASGLTDPDISLAAAVHLFAWADVDKPCALNGPQFLTTTLIENDFIPTTGTIKVPDQPGLGIELSERAEAVLKTVAEL